MMGLLWEILCWLQGGHFIRRTPRIVNGRWVTRMKCMCGVFDQEVDGLPEHPGAPR